MQNSKRGLTSWTRKGALFASASFLLPAAAVAQNTAPPATTAQERSNDPEVVVTGSRIPRAVTSALPVTIVDRAEIERTGTNTVAELLTQLPVIQGDANSRTDLFGSQGVENINLRGLGANRTLVLIDGRRTSFGGAGANATVDLSTIPGAFVQRIEVLRDGASALYGSDAMAGVVNIITRKDYQGLRLDSEFGITDRGDDERYKVSLMFGAQGDRGGFTVIGSYERYDGILGPAGRPLFACQLFDSGTPPRPTCGGSGNTPYPIARLLANSPATGFTNGQQVVVNPDGSLRLRNALTDQYNFQTVTYFATPSERYGIALNAHYDLTDDIRVFVSSFYSRRDQAETLAAFPLSNLRQEANTPGNVFGVPVLINRRPVEYGNRDWFYTNQQFRVAMGLEGRLPNGWRWDVSGVFARSEAANLLRNSFNLERVQNAINGCPNTIQAGNVRCPTGVNFLNPARIPQAFFDYVGVDEQYSGYNEVASIEANLSGDLGGMIDLPGGPVEFALGIVGRREAGGINPSPLQLAGLSVNNLSRIAGREMLREGYLEVRLPILRGMPGAEELTLTAANRVSDYSSFGTRSNYKVSLEWAPLDGIRFRGLYGRGFRAASIPERFGGGSTNLQNFEDPCFQATDATLVAACAALGPGAAAGTGGFLNITFDTNRNIQPETSTNWGLGVVVAPRALPGFSITIDYYNIDIQNLIGREPVFNFVRRCTLNRNASTACAGVRRAANGSLLSIYQTNDNIGQLQTSGIDFSIRYQTDIPGIGNLALSADGNLLLSFRAQSSPLEPSYQLRNANVQANDALRGGHFRHRWNLGQVLNTGNFSFSLRQRILSDQAIVNFSPPPGASIFCNTTICSRDRIPAQVYVDAQIKYSWDRFEITAGANNITDNIAPYIPPGNFGPQNTDPGSYDVIGRTYYVRLGIKL